jgi:TctA family transporter
MVTDDRAAPHAWLDASALRTASDIALGCVLLAAAATIFVGAGGMSFGTWNRLGPGFFPSAIGGLLVVAGLILLVRGVLLGTPPAARWSLSALAIIVALYGIVNFAVWAWESALYNLALRFGPPEFATLILVIFAVAIALARLSRVRAVGMMLLGLLLAMVGTHVSTGTERFTMGLAQLTDGLMFTVVSVGLIVVADALICLVSPSLWLATYARRVAGWTDLYVPTIAGVGVRLVAALTIAAACYYAFELNRTIWDVGVLVVFGLFGIACKILGWNRPVLILGAYYGAILEDLIRQAVLMSRGDPAIFLRSPISGAFLLLAIVVLALMAAFSVWRGIMGRRPVSLQS